MTVSEFKGNPLIDIREFWINDSGELKPGKKVSRYLWQVVYCVNSVTLGHFFDD